ALETRDASPDAAAIDLEALLAGASPADPAGQARERVVALGEARKPIAELRELDLELAVSRTSALGEDVEDQLGAVDHSHGETLAQVAGLRRREVAVEDHELGVMAEGAHHEVLEAALADHRARVALGAVLEHHVRHLDAGRARQLAELVERFLRLAARASGAHRDQHGALG